ncbi:MAG TPA: DUF4442 domain-containing protein [Candidatus Corynebacterium gallistercoris]|uniref:DUF4442 domain-containing protein n=1 Tax=Candidatus Corynebacterium gallistercoris TaxID=2838530 RepID=A0A9D1RYK7_9CORY|nr:DUF4442 domain-containing protein [Candidatus Corynebacterium gallistercoris]
MNLTRFLFATPRRLKFTLNAFPPLAASGIRIHHISEDWSQATVSLRLHWWNKNMHGAAFGGTLFSMTDAFFGTLVMKRLGPDFEAWTRTGTFQYLNPGHTDDTLQVSIPDDLVTRIKDEVAEDGFCNVPHTSTIYSPQGTIVGIGQQTLHVRKRRSPEARRSRKDTAATGTSQPRPYQPGLTLRGPRGIDLASIATAVAWQAFADEPGRLASILSQQRRLPSPEDQAVYVCGQALSAGLIGTDDLQKSRVPERVIRDAVAIKNK